MKIRTEADIRAALLNLDVDNSDHWTLDGLPALHAIGLFGVKRADVTAAAPLFNRSSPFFETAENRTNADSRQLSFEATTEESGEDEEKAAIAEAEAEAEAEAVAAKGPIAEADRNLAEAEESLKKAKKAVEEALKERDVLLQEKEKVKHPHQNQMDIMEFIESQKLLRMERFNKAKLMVESFKAPIDQAFSRTTGYGRQRPKALPLKR